MTTRGAVSFSVNRDSTAGIATGYGLDDRASIPGRDFLCFSTFRPAMGPTSYSVGTGDCFPGGKATVE
jgi:hypothetical protein